MALPAHGLRDPVVSEGGHMVWRDGGLVAGVAGISGCSRESDRVTVAIGSGRYRFEIVATEDATAVGSPPAP